MADSQSPKVSFGAALVKTINGLVHQLNTLGTNAIHLAVSSVSLEAELARLHERLAPPKQPPLGGDANHGPIVRRCVNDRCRSRNPSAARFCRRCGKVLA